MAEATIDDLAVTTLRTLAMDTVQKANSGHPGTPVAMAPVVYTLWQEFLQYDPEQPTWPNRDRFVLSAGHASSMLYSLLHVAQVKDADGNLAVPLSELQRFRQIGSKTPGHPEHGWTAGVEATTGPLGTGFATSVGMAIAGQWLAARYNRPGFELFGHNIWSLGGDGCMMEGVAQEAASLAGHLGLGNLTWIYDSNRITIEGSTDLAFSENVPARYAAMGWHVIEVADANDRPAVAAAFAAAKAETERPTLVVVTSEIAWGAPTKHGTSGAHGEPLGAEEIRGAKRFYGWPEDESFLVPAEVLSHVAAGLGARGRAAREQWEALLASYATAYPADAAELTQLLSGELPAGWDAELPTFAPDAKGKATRETSGVVLNALAKGIPWLVGGAADLAPSTKTFLTGLGAFSREDRGGRNLHLGVREHAAGCIANGLALSGLRAFQSGFLIFSDFQRGAVRLSALQELPVVHVWTHDSIGVGEDGPTHQPIEQIPSLRAIPGLIDLRPGDANEVVEAWRVVAGLRHNPAALFLSRQAMPTLDREVYAPAAGLAKGGYVLSDPADGRTPEVILIASGSELQLALSAADALTADGVAVRVVSLPSWALFAQQSAEYRASVLPPAVTARVAVEATSTFGWERYVGITGAVVGMTGFGASAPLSDLLGHFGFTTEAVVAAAKAQIAL